MKKIEISDIIIWISLLVLVFYVFGKLTGLINSPEWLALLPIISLTFFAGAFYQKVLSFMNQMYIRTDYIKSNLDDHEARLSNLENK